VKLYEVRWNERAAGSIRQFATTLKGVKQIKDYAKKRYSEDHEGQEMKKDNPDYPVVLKLSFKNTGELIKWMNVHCRNNECCSDE